MAALPPILMTPQKLEMWLVLYYVAAVLVAARIIERLARWHFARAQAYNERGFEYVPDEDHYRCPGGERLRLHQYQPEARLAIYRAPRHACNACPLKRSCTPHGEGRHLYRSMAQRADTDVGRFHLGVSLLIFAVSVAVSAVALVHWLRQPGAGFLALLLFLSVASLSRAARRIRPKAAAPDRLPPARSA